MLVLNVHFVKGAKYNNFDSDDDGVSKLRIVVMIIREKFYLKSGDFKEEMGVYILEKREET